MTLQFFIKLGVPKIAICIPDPAVEGKLVVRLSHGMKEASNKILKASAPGKVAAAEAYRRNRMLNVVDYDDTEYALTDLEHYVGIGAALYVPISQSPYNEVLGVLILAQDPKSPFTEEAAEAAETMGLMLAEYLQAHPVRIEHIDALLDKGDAQAGIDELSHAYQRCIDTRDIFELSDMTMEYCLKLTGSEFGFVGYIDPANGFLTVPTLTKEIYPESKIEGKTMVFEKPGGLGGLVLDTDRYLVANDPLNHPASVGTPPGHLPIRKFMGVPCMIHGRKVGMIALANKLEDYTEADLQLVQTFASLYATSVSNFFSREALRETKEKFVALYNDAPVSYFTIGLDGMIEEINESGKSLLSFTGDEAADFNVFLDEAGRQLFNERIKNLKEAHGESEPLELLLTVGDKSYTVLLSMTPKFDERGYVRHVHCSALNISERKCMEERLNFMAYHDEATLLPNRAMMRRHLDASLERSRREGHKVGLLLFDLDRFKNINDTLGHDVGDKLLQAIALKLKSHFRGVDIISRFGGDEFVLIIDEVRTPDDLSVVAAKLIEQFNSPFEVGDRKLYISSSVGISVFPEDAVNAEEMIKNADTAMYRSKERGGSGFTYYRQEFNVAGHERLALEADLRRGLDQNEFELHYQPQYEIGTGKITGVEALLRWKHSEKGMISPLRFIPMAEENGYIMLLGKWVIEKALEQLHAWNRSGVSGLKMSINVSAKQFLHSEDLPELFESLIVRHALDPDDICIEITESTLANIDEMTRQLNRLKSLGITIAVDDFGTGYSSLAYLRKLPIGILKIDKSFVDDIGKNRDDEAISKAIISMAHAMGMEVVAEGVETAEHLDFLRENGCRYYQGYYGSRPLPTAEVGILLNA